MIIYTMNDAEILEAVKKDLGDLMKISDTHEKWYRRSIIKASKFPIYFPAIHRKLRSGNNWYFLYEARSKRDRKEESRVSFVCLVDSPIGIYAIMPTFTNKLMHTIMYKPHFFARYRTRFGIDLQSVELRLRYFQRNYNYTFEFNKRMVNEENYIEEVFGSSSEGVALGVSTTNGNILFRTFITEDMLKGNQISTYLENNEIRKEIHESLK